MVEGQCICYNELNETELKENGEWVNGPNMTCEISVQNFICDGLTMILISTVYPEKGNIFCLSPQTLTTFFIF